MAEDMERVGRIAELSNIKNEIARSHGPDHALTPHKVREWVERIVDLLGQKEVDELMK